VTSYLTWLRPRVGREVTSIAPDALEALHHYAWPGNVRELINVIERAMLLCDGDQVRLCDLPDTIRDRPTESHAAGMVHEGGGMTQSLDRPLQVARQEVLERFERLYLVHHLQRCGGRMGDTAKRIGLEPRTLFNKMKQYGLRKEDFRGNGPAD